MNVSRFRLTLRGLGIVIVGVTTIVPSVASYFLLPVLCVRIVSWNVIMLFCLHFTQCLLRSSLLPVRHITHIRSTDEALKRQNYHRHVSDD